MTSALSSAETTNIFYPSGDGEPVAETYDHCFALLTTLEVLRQYLAGQQATVLGNQFLYYSQGFPRLRVAPDVMVIFGVEPVGRDNYKIWDEGQVPQVIFEMTSESTRTQDSEFKKTLYQQLGVQEYWMFDPRGEWIDTTLVGYRLIRDTYEPITDSRSEPLGLRLAIEGKFIAFYREDTGEKLLIPDELAERLQQETQARVQAEAEAEQERQRAEQERQRAEQERQRAEELEAALARYRERFGDLPDA
ncbi:MAG: Uma2 family endonuclease [Elainellaceae cyanobacterium]